MTDTACFLSFDIYQTNWLCVILMDLPIMLTFLLIQIIKTTKQKNNSLSLLSCDFTFLFFWGLTYIYIYIHKLLKQYWSIISAICIKYM
jgi:hypothetical protein